ncbi:conserved exported hypothetical protein [Candidatus Sulfopaludibacter sp. SbA3]|nr:conserved exported hypothetical protein [Candidatus Sulfopaludibacter sp. SbA3]
MFKMSALAGVMILSTALWAADNELTPAEKKAGWILLFDGKSFAHWDDPTKRTPPGDSFVIEDGCLKSTSHPKITEDLFSADTYGDFELVWDWKISPKGNSGLKYRIQDHVFLPDVRVPRFEPNVNAALQNRRTDRPAKGQDYVIGFEYQMTDNATNSDAMRNGKLHQTAALYDIFPPVKDATKAIGEFNQSRLVARVGHVEHWLNGERVMEGSLQAPDVAASMAKRWGEGSAVYELLVKQPVKACHISLQNHDDVAWFKNIKIRRMP